jgi:hypothetical protein
MAQGLQTGEGPRATLLPLISGVLALLSWSYPFLLYAISFPVALALYWWFEEPTTPTPSIDGGQSSAYRLDLLRLLRQCRVLAIVVARAMPNVV